MKRTLLLATVLCLSATQALAQQRVPPEPDAPNRVRRRAPPAPEPDRPVRQAPVLERFEPDRGTPGSQVILHGQHFDETCIVRFNGRDLEIVQRTEKTLTVRIPKRSESDRFVVFKAGFREIASDQTFNVVQKPHIRMFKPSEAGPGDSVTILGESFLPEDVFVLGETRMEVQSFKPDRVVVKVPEGAGTAPIRLLRAEKQEAATRRALDVILGAPEIVSFTPTIGIPSTVVRLQTRNLEPGDVVELSGKVVPVVHRGADFIEVRIQPAHVTGRFVLVGRRSRRVESADLFTVVRPPRVESFSPRYGSPATVITVTGVGFLEGDQVMVGEGILTTRSLTHNTITAEIPAGLASGKVAIRRGDRRFPANGVFTVIEAPVISEIAPMAGPVGTEVVISGRNLLDDTQVTLAGRPLVILRKKLPDEVTVQIPEGARSGNIVVVTRAGSARSEGIFEVKNLAAIRSFYPLHALPGTRVTLRGDDFHPGVKVFLGAIELTIVRQSREELEVQIPEGAVTARFAILSHGRKIEGGQVFTVDEPRPEIVFDFNPKRGPRGSEVTLTIDPPQQDVLILFDERPLPKKTLQAGRQVVVTIPGDARDGFFEVEYNGRRYRAKEAFKVSRGR